ncbi:hypothetical protein ACI6Q2_14750 [Chitinophagaceae bacterium LWZ2-11]
MRYPETAICILIFACVSCSSKPNKIEWTGANPFTNGDTVLPANRSAYSYATAHPNAQALLKDSFYWSLIAEPAPFGSDDGYDAAYGFREWRNVHKSEAAIIYLKELISRWQYPIFDWKEMDTTKIKAYLSSAKEPSETEIQERMQELKEVLKNDSSLAGKPTKPMDDNQLRALILSTSQQIGGSYLLGQDNAIIATGFAQFVLEGRVDKDLKELTTIALKRELLPMLINRYSEEYRVERKKRLTQMLEVVEKMNS